MQKRSIPLAFIVHRDGSCSRNPRAIELIQADLVALSQRLDELLEELLSDGRPHEWTHRPSR